MEVASCRSRRVELEGEVASSRSAVESWRRKGIEVVSCRSMQRPSWEGQFAELVDAELGGRVSGVDAAFLMQRS